MDVLADFGLWGMFASAFLAATILPLSSEVVMSCLLVSGFDLYGTVAVATLGNVLGSLVNYALGFAGSRFLLEKIFRVSSKEIHSAGKRFTTHGTACLLLAWVPGIGDPLTVVAGMLKISIWIFLLLVTLGKLGRYIALSWALTSF